MEEMKYKPSTGEVTDYVNWLNSLTIDELIVEKDKTDDELYEVHNKLVDNTSSFEEFRKLYRNTTEFHKYNIVRDIYESRLTPDICKNRNMINQTTKEALEIGAKYTVEQFEDMCSYCAICGSDGFGYYADDEYEYNIQVSTYKASKKDSNKNFKYIIWYNK